MDDVNDAPGSIDTGTGVRGGVAAEACLACGSMSTRSWDTPEGRVRLCNPCAVVHGIGCP